MHTNRRKKIIKNLCPLGAVAVQHSSASASASAIAMDNADKDQDKEKKMDKEHNKEGQEKEKEEKAKVKDKDAHKEVKEKENHVSKEKAEEADAAADTRLALFCSSDPEDRPPPLLDSDAPAPPPPGRLSTPDWMGNLPPSVKCRPMCRLAIPGSHNSFTYSIDKDSPVGPDHDRRLQNFANRCKWLTRPFIFRWAVCQRLSVTGQLELGVRYLDFRLCREYFKLMEEIAEENRSKKKSNKSKSKKSESKRPGR